MKYFSFFIIFFLSCFDLFSQVGVFTESPKASLDIIHSIDNPVPSGILVPRMTGDQIEAMPVNTDQNSMLVYAIKVSNSAKPIVTEVGFWFYDAVDVTWKPLSCLRRRNVVNINPDGTEDYISLQEAYDKEAKKLYSPGVSFLQFNCKGDVGDLLADGGIPSVKIVGVSGSSIGKLTVYNSILSFGGEINTIENMIVVNSYVTLSSTLSNFKAEQLNFKKCLVDVSQSMKVSNIILDQSSMNIVQSNLNIDFEPTTPIAEGLLLKFSSFKGLISTTLHFNGNQTFVNYIKCDDSSFLSSQGTVKASAPVSNAVILSMQASKASMGTILGTAVPKTLFHALTGGKIEHFRGDINMNTSGSAFLAVTGAEILLGGDATTGNSVITNVSTNPTSFGFSALGGDVKLNSTVKLQTYTLNNYQYALFAGQGGKIITLNRVLQGTSTSMSNLVPGVVNSSGAVIYTGN